MIGRKNIDNTWKEEWELNLMLFGSEDIKNIYNPIEIRLNDILIEFVTKEISGYISSGTYKYNNIEYCAYIPYSNKVFNGYGMQDELIREEVKEDLYDKLVLVRENIEAEIEKYLRENNYIELELDEEDITPVLEGNMPF